MFASDQVSKSRRFSQASDVSAFYSARSSSPSRMDLDESREGSSREASLGPRRKKPRLSRVRGKRSLSATPPDAAASTSTWKRGRVHSPEITRQPPSSGSGSGELGELAAQTVKQLKERMQAIGLSFAGLVEKKELIARLIAHRTSGNSRENFHQNPPAATSQTEATPCSSARTVRRSRASEDAGSQLLSEISRVEKVLSRGGGFREILGLGQVAFTLQEISSVTKKLYRLVHPDKAPAAVRERATTIFDAVRKAEAEAQRQCERRSKVAPGAVAEIQFAVDKSKEVVTIKWRMQEGTASVARPDRFHLAAGSGLRRVEQGEVTSSGDGEWYEFSISNVSRKGNDELFASRAFYMYVTPVNEAGRGPEGRVFVSLKDEAERRGNLPSFSGLTNFLKRHNTASF